MKVIKIAILLASIVSLKVFAAEGSLSAALVHTSHLSKSKEEQAMTRIIQILNVIAPSPLETDAKKKGLAHYAWRDCPANALKTQEGILLTIESCPWRTVYKEYYFSTPQGCQVFGLELGKEDPELLKLDQEALFKSIKRRALRHSASRLPLCYAIEAVGELDVPEVKIEAKT